ncbi:MAG: hypothetical protein CL881_01765 [Dehalococcoidia bacterium]|nr:hypothetical protein [Dehalococcoidia bacterium]
MIGRGSFGEVYKCDGKAVKLVRLKSWEDVASVVKEMNVLQRQLKGCIRYHGKLITKGKHICYSLYMDLADGDLRKFAAPPGADKQLLHAVYNLHSNNILHMDIKPENILVRGNHIFLCDFGLSTMVGELNRDNYVVSRWYRAPEIYFCKARRLKYTKAMDCWSVGCVLYEIKHRKPLNRKMSYVFNIEDPMIRKLTIFSRFKRWSIAQCLNIDEPNVVNNSIELNDFYKSYYNENPAKLKVLQHAQTIYNKKGDLDKALLQSILLMDNIADYDLKDKNFHEFVKYI